AFAQDGSKQLASGLEPILKLLNGQEPKFAITASAKITIDRNPVDVDLRLVRHSDSAFDLDVTHAKYSVSIRRRADAIAFALPHHRVVFLGTGQADEKDRLEPNEIAARIVSPASMIAVYAPLITNSNASSASLVLSQLLKIKFDSKTQRWSAGEVSFAFGE